MTIVHYYLGRPARVWIAANSRRSPARQARKAADASATASPASLPRYGGRRRVTGLRRDEVAQLAGISIEYYTRLERGNIRGVSDEVLDGIARALHLDEVERAHLLDLVRMANASRRRAAAPRRRGSARASGGCWTR